MEDEYYRFKTVRFGWNVYYKGLDRNHPNFEKHRRAIVLMEVLSKSPYEEDCKASLDAEVGRI